MSLLTQEKWGDEKKNYMGKMGEIDLCGESGRALPSLKWLGECQAKFPSEMLGMAQTQRAAMFLWEQGSLGCTGIDAVSLWDPLS